MWQHIILSSPIMVSRRKLFRLQRTTNCLQAKVASDGYSMKGNRVHDIVSQQVARISRV